MRNLAGDKHASASVRDELSAVGVPVVEIASPGEVPSKYAGELGQFKFRRAWYYWVVSGPVPLSVARELYEDPIGRTDVRSGGDCACRPPETWADHFDASDAAAAAHRSVVSTYHIDSGDGLRIFVDMIRRHGLDKSTSGPVLEGEKSDG